MKIGPKYKIARRLGANIFDKTQSPKFAQRSERRQKTGKGGNKSRPKTDYGIQMLEKQKARYMYGMNERQFGNYVKKALSKKSVKASETLFMMLESRLDNVVYRMGLANSRSFARQMVSHGHITVNGGKVTIPSYQVSLKDIIRVREASMKKKMFEEINKRLESVIAPPWMKFDPVKKEATIEEAPKLTPGGTIFDINAIIQFYQR